MSKLGLLSALLALAVLNGCGGGQTPKGAGKGNMDAPIVVSDELHVKHAHHVSGSPDFQINLGTMQVMAFSDTHNKPIQYIHCENMSLVDPPSGYLDCMGKDYPVASSGGQWRLDIFDASGASLVTLTPSSNPPCTNGVYCQVMVNPYSYVLADAEDDGSNGGDSDTAGGTDLAVRDTAGMPLTFASALITDMSTTKTAKMSCMNTSSHACKIRIEYNSYDNPTPTPTP